MGADISEILLPDSQNGQNEWQVLARKYRPLKFAQVIGQDVIVKILSNAISFDRVATSYLLCGPRGTGKTTLARILALSLNCLSRSRDSFEPCGECANCKAISSGRHIDVIEIDAASNTGVDNIRDLIEESFYKPVDGEYKIYIIDETHMLSKAAFNALLKTLEEPSSRIKFIFATTEVEKIPMTVVSRCQRFDFKRVSEEEISAHIKHISSLENVRLSASAGALISRFAEGSVRDALSLLDTAMSGGKQEIEEEFIREVLGLVERSQIFKLFDFLIKADATNAVKHFAHLYDQGGQPEAIFIDLLNICHMITRKKLSKGKIGDNISASESLWFERASASMGISLLNRVWQLLLKGLEEVKKSPLFLQSSEMVLIRVAYAASLPPVEEAVKRFSDMADDGNDIAKEDMKMRSLVELAFAEFPLSSFVEKGVEKDLEKDEISKKETRR